MSNKVSRVIIIRVGRVKNTNLASKCLFLARNCLEVAGLGPPPNGTSIGNILAWVCTVPNVAYCVNLENSLKYPLSGPKRPILLNKIFVKNDFIIAKFSQKAEFVGFINVRCLIKSPE